MRPTGIRHAPNIQDGTCSQGSNWTTGGLFGSGVLGGGAGTSVWKGNMTREASGPLRVAVTTADATTQGATAAATRQTRQTRPDRPAILQA